MKINVKWQKEVLKDIDVDLDESPMVFKMQLYSLTGVPVDRQKVMGKGGMLADDSWGKTVLKEGQTIMMMGSADKVPVAPTETAQFVEDLPEEAQAAAETRQYGAGLVNLGNTCYMNSCLQCLYAVPELRQTLVTFQPDSGASGSAASSAMLASQAGKLFTMMAKGGSAMPSAFLMFLRSKFPQFDQLGTQAGPTGQRGHAQQDAEECWTQVMYAWREALAKGSSNPIQELFGVKLHTELKCIESDEVVEEETETFNIKCNITIDINHLNEGLKLAMVEDREKNSEALGRIAQWRGKSTLTQLPPYLTIQLMRFFYKVETQNKAKILRKVAYPLQLDVLDLCSDGLKAQLKGPRWAFKTIEDLKVGIKEKPKDAAAGPSKGATDADGDSAMDAPEEVQDHTGAHTGRYDLLAVLTHKGRTLDSGHYEGWVKQADGSWIEFDDDAMVAKRDEDILALNGGGDWHMAYLLLYKAQRVPPKPPADGEATSSAEPTPAA